MSSEVDTLPDDADPVDPEAGVHVSVAVPAPADRVWKHLVSAEGTEALLGEGARLGGKGEPWHATDGSWRDALLPPPRAGPRDLAPARDGPLSMLDVQLRPDADGTRVELFHEGRGIAGDPRGDWRHWEDALHRLAGLRT